MAQPDHRITKTDEQIHNALLTLCAAHVPFETVSVRRLAATANISRQTFYRHYASPKDVILTLVQQHLHTFLTTFSTQTLTASSMTHQLLTSWQHRRDVFLLVEWSGLRQQFIQQLADFNQQIAHHQQTALIDETAICNMYAATTYMFLRSYVLDQKWSINHATTLFLHITNHLDLIFK